MTCALIGSSGGSRPCGGACNSGVCTRHSFLTPALAMTLLASAASTGAGPSSSLSEPLYHTYGFRRTAADTLALCLARFCRHARGNHIIHERTCAQAWVQQGRRPDAPERAGNQCGTRAHITAIATNAPATQTARRLSTPVKSAPEPAASPPATPLLRALLPDIIESVDTCSR